MPGWLRDAYAVFPLITYPAPQAKSLPKLPTLWLLGPPPSTGSSFSLDPDCRIAQALAQFAGVKVGVKWVSSSAGGVGRRVPNLHLPDGSLLSHEDLPTWFLHPDSRANPSKAQPAAPQDPIYQAFRSLIRSSLLPATLAAVYLAQSPPAVTPPKAEPFLSSLASSVGAKLERRAKVAEVQKLRGGKAGYLDLDELDREAVDALEAFETKLKERSKEGGIEGWFDGAG